jgi:4-nitrophenyl phosphatase
MAKSMNRKTTRSDFESLGRSILGKELGALQALEGQLDWEVLERALEMLLACDGTIWITGAGTSSTIARRLAHTLTCSGIPAAFLDPGQAQHGYAGILRERDLLLGLSRGGETDEVNHLLAVARSQNTAVISILEGTTSHMADHSTLVIPYTIEPEHDAEGFIPFSSTLAQAVIGDLLCAGVLQARGYSDQAFTELHPGGAVGKRLSTVELSNTPTSRDLHALRGLVIDMDGVLWHGEAPLPGLADFFQTLENLGIKYVLATNNPSKRPEDFAEKARRFGIQVEAADVVTCVQAVQQYLHEKYPQGSRVHVIGERALKDQVKEAGYELADDDVVAVVVALERALSHETLKRGTLLIRAGAEFIGTNADPSYPTEEGFVPGSGMVVIALAATAATKPVIMGKPERAIFDLALAKLGLPVDQVASVGDRLDTDIEGGRRLGMQTVLLLSGIASAADVQTSDTKPDWVFNNLEEFARALRA